MSEPVYLSVVVPAYNEEKRLRKGLMSILSYFESKDFRSELIVVDDGSVDRTRKIAEAFGDEVKKRSDRTGYEAVSNPRNVGKGFSVARGIELARGERILFTDADLSAPIGQADELLLWIDKGFDMVIGSRRLPDSKVDPQPFHRRFMGLCFRLLTSLLVVRGFKDTQCGFKMYTREAGKAIAKLQMSPGFVFDVEQLFIARKLGLKVLEAPVFWADDRETKVRVLADPFKMAIGLMKIRIIHTNLDKDRTI
ncbi:glycosyltransferase family 2 protein [bacterium]|nr:glycosyltransferase family 2 protein [bacterium]